MIAANDGSVVPPIQREACNRQLRQRIAAEAVRWIGTPYCHQGSTRQVGADCLGLLVGVWSQVTAQHFNLMRTEQRDWASHAKGEPLLDGLNAHLLPINADQAGAGDVIALRWRARWPASHLAILMGDGSIIHAYEGGRVVRSNVSAWRSNIAAIFRFPNTTNLDH
ncbi:MAG: NlpC/P60 family protein [Pseudomonadota bacterium]